MIGMRRSGCRVGYIAGLLLVVWHSAIAHVVVTPDSAVAGRPAVLTFGVPEGCAGSPTRSLEISIPTPIKIVKPQPKAGWTIEMAYEPLEEPLMSEGVVQKKRVSTIKWTGGPLPDSHYEQFVMIVKLPANVGKLYFPAIQTCVKGEIRWIEQPDSRPTGVRHAAPVLNLTAPAGR